MRVQCFKAHCQSVRWNPTGRLETNRHGRLAAVIRCEKCGYHWLSTLPEALDAAKTLLESQGREMPTVATVRNDPNDHEPAGFILPLTSAPKRQRFASVGDLVQDFKAKAAGGDE